MDNGIAPNAKKLLWAGFFTIAASGVGFGVRAGILSDWGAQFGFTKTTLGSITGGGLTGFGVVIILCSLFLDRIGYKPLMVFAFLCHVLSIVLTLVATPVHVRFGPDATYQCLFWGMFLFAVGNGACEAVVNPLTATLFPRQKTHYLNILHAGWPGGLVAGSLATYFLTGHVRWEFQMCLFLIPTALYGFMMLPERFPEPEVKRAGVTFGESLAQFASPILLLLLLLHAMVGYVELGTDSWISNITGEILEDPRKGLLLFVYTSALMFALRFFAGPIVHRISPLGLLFVCSLLGAAGLVLLGNVKTGAIMMCVLAATVYALGKTFYWPTMLAVVSERFPKGGALTIGAMGGVGMLSAGLLGGPAIGYKQDYAATEHLKEIAPGTYVQYVSDQKRGLYGLVPEIAGLDGSKVAAVTDNGAQLRTDMENLAKAGK
ncbi:MAG TPA: MFS transporter, partial [Planctomycetota bacterium]|nr:MFS transporter [Planctomycetota bacterium]